MRGFIRRPSKKAWLSAGLGLMAIVVLGGGAYAALGGIGRTQAGSDVELQRGLIGWWKLDGNAKDSTPYQNNGTITGTTRVADHKARAGGAYSFAGSPDNINVPYSPVLYPTNAVSIGVWFKSGAMTSPVERIVSNFSSGGYSLYRTGTASGDTCGDNNLCFKVRVSGTDRVISTAYSGLTAGNWYYIAATYDGNYLRLYLNGALVSTSANFAGSITNTNNYAFCIGAATTVTGCSSNRLDGCAIDDVRLYSRALSGAEVTALNDAYDPGLQAAGGENGLVGWWKLDGNSKDSTPYANSGTITAASLTTDRKGATNRAYTFNGTTSYIDAGNGASLNPSRNTVSISAWVKGTVVNTGGNVKGIACKDAGGTTNTPFCIYVINGRFNIQVTNSSDVIAGAASPSADNIQDNTWYHVVGTYDGTNTRIYVNGVLRDTQPQSGNLITSSGNFFIGRQKTGFSTRFFAGTIDDVRVYNRVLSASEIAGQYNSYDSQINLNSSPTSTTGNGNINTGLVGYWPLNGNARDATPYSDNGVITGATLTTDHKGRANSAYSFSGNPNTISVANASVINPTTNVSVGVWFQANTASLGALAGQRIVATYDSGVPSGYALIVTGPSSADACGVSVVCFRAFVGGTGYAATAPISNLVTGTWYYLTGTYDGSNVRLFINGTQVGSTSATGALTASAKPLCIGAAPNGTTCSANYINGGAIDEVRVYNRALSTTEIQALYSSAN